MINRIIQIVVIISCFLLNNLCFSQKWTRKADFGGIARLFAVSFSIGSKGYVLTGDETGNDFWEYDQATNKWTRKADFPGEPRTEAVGFSIGTKGYIGTGFTTTFSKDFWEWDQATNTWTRKADFGGNSRVDAIGFSIGTKGYIGFGNKGHLWPDTFCYDFWEWDQATNTWTQKANNPNARPTGAVGFSIGNIGYTNSTNNDFWAWDQATNTWLKKASFPGVGRRNSIEFVIGTKGYIATGDTTGDFTSYVKDLWEYNSVTDSWIQKIDFDGTPRFGAIGFSIGNKGYIGLGWDADSLRSDFWEYCDTCTVGIDGFNSLQNFSVFPNPATTDIYIKSTDAASKSFIEIYNAYGNLIYSNTFTSNCNIGVSGFAGGLYFLRVKNNKYDVSMKVIIEK